MKRTGSNMFVQGGRHDICQNFYATDVLRSQNLRNRKFAGKQQFQHLSSAFPAVGSLWQLLATYGNFWQMLATNGNFWQMLATFGICNYCLCLCHLVNSVKGQFKRLVNIEILISFLTVENNKLTTFIVIHSRATWDRISC